MTDERFQKYFNRTETISTLAEKYGVTRQTLRRWMLPIRNELRIEKFKTIRPTDLKKIIEFLGEYPVDDLHDFHVK